LLTETSDFMPQKMISYGEIFGLQTDTIPPPPTPCKSTFIAAIQKFLFCPLR
jgi:hypothetical protein